MAIGLVLNRRSQVPAENSPAFGAIAERFRRAGDLDRAVALCQEGLAKFPDHLSARVTLGWALLDLGRHREAQAELERVIKRAPDNLAAIRGLAQLHDRMENADASDLQNPSAWQIVDDAPEQGTEPVLSDEPSPLPEFAPAAAAIEFEPAASAVVDDPIVAEPAQVEHFGVHGQAPAPASQEPSASELDAEVERLLKAIGPPVVIMSDDAPVVRQVQEAASVAEPEPFGAGAEAPAVAAFEISHPIAPAVAAAPAAEVAPITAAAPVAASTPVQRVARVEPAAVVARVEPVAAVEPAAVVAPVEPVAAVEPFTVVAPVAAEPAAGVAAVQSAAPAAHVELVAPVDIAPAAPAIPAVVVAAEPATREDVTHAAPPAGSPVVAQFEDVPIQLVTPAEAVAFKPEPVEDEELPPASAFAEAPESALDPIFVLDAGLPPEPVLEVASEPAPKFAAQFMSRLETETAAGAVDKPAQAAQAAPEVSREQAPDVLSRLTPSVAPDVRPAAAAEVVFGRVSRLSEPPAQAVGPKVPVVELPAPSSRAPVVDGRWAPEPDELLELLPDPTPDPVLAAEPVVELADAPLLDLIDPSAIPVTIDIRPEPTRHDLPAVVLTARRERPAAPAPALAALEKFLRQVEVRKVQRMRQPVAS